jgi:hypothetical protein
MKRASSEAYIDMRKSAHTINGGQLRNRKLKITPSAIRRRLGRGIAPSRACHDTLAYHLRSMAHTNEIALAFLSKRHIKGLPAISTNACASDPAGNMSSAV